MARTLTPAAETAKLIRKELKAAFPGVKFRVRSRNFSMGDAVDIEWDLGPTTAQVEAVAKKYQDGDFNGMTDSYELDHSRPGGAKYVQCQRGYRFDGLTEDEAFDRMCRDLCELYPDVNYAGPHTPVYSGGRGQLSDLLHRIRHASPLMDGYHGFRRTGQKAGLIEQMIEAY